MLKPRAALTPQLPAVWTQGSALCGSRQREAQQLWGIVVVVHLGMEGAAMLGS